MMTADPLEAAAAIRRSPGGQPTVGLILGSGLGSLAESIQGLARTSYDDVPGMQRPTAAGHVGEFVLGSLGGRQVAAMRGRLHTYEGHSSQTVTFPVRVLAALGCQTLIVTNAAGGLDPAHQVGDLMAIVDHIYFPGLAGQNPLVGVEGHRFVDMVGAYAPELLELAETQARRIGIPLSRGVYAMVAGPSFETPAEIRMLRSVGADAVGMSTAPEVVVARQLGMRVLGISCITNIARADAPLHVDHHHVVAVGNEAGPRLRALVSAVLEGLPS